LTATGSTYAELRRTVAAQHLLDRAYGYYALRGGASFALLGAALLVPFVVPTAPITAVPCALLIGFSSVQVALIGHDAGHLAVFQRNAANWTLGSVCWSLCAGISFWWWYDRHNRHHALTNDISGDPDLQWAGLVDYSEDTLRARAGWRRWLSRYQAMLAPLYVLFLPFAFRLEGWQFAFDRLEGRRRLVELTLLGISTLCWLCPTLVLHWWWIAAYVLSQAMAGVYLALVVAPNHKGMPVWSAGLELSYLERQVLSSRNVRPHRIGDFLFGGLNYQIEHHLFPTMPRVHFSRARAVVKPFCLEHGLPYDEMGALASYRLVLAELRRVGQAVDRLAAAG
jgi:fatty acid desaturase